MEGVEDLKQQLKALQEKREEATKIKKLKKQIRGEKFAQTKSGKVFNKIADIGEMGLRTLSKPSPSGKKKKYKSVKEIMAQLPQ